MQIGFVRAYKPEGLDGHEFWIRVWVWVSWTNVWPSGSPRCVLICAVVWANIWSAISNPYPWPQTLAPSPWPLTLHLHICLWLHTVAHTQLGFIYLHFLCLISNLARTISLSTSSLCYILCCCTLRIKQAALSTPINVYYNLYSMYAFGNVRMACSSRRTFVLEKYNLFHLAFKI